MSFTTRPELRGTFGMVASTHWLASASAMSILEKGGNAFDAAVAGGFVLQVVEPHLNGPLGDVVMLTADSSSGQVEVLCGQGTAPAAATIGHYRSLGLDLVPGTGLLAAVVPGALGAWLRLLDDRGTLPLADVLGPAIGYARSGYPLVPMITAAIASVEGLFRTEWTTSAPVYLPDGEVPEPLELFANPTLADTFERILVEATAAGGSRERQIEAARRACYDGFVADAIDRFCRDTEVMDTSGRRHRGLLTGDDLAGWQASVEAPVGIDFGRYTLLKAGPWSQGPVALQQLALLQGFDLATLGATDPDFVHLVTESAKLAFADREAFYGDPAVVPVPLETLLSDEYNAARRDLIDERASAELRPGTVGGFGGPVDGLKTVSMSGPGLGIGEPTVARETRGRGDTCHIAVVDRHGNMVAATPSGGWLQSSPVIPELGVSLGTRGQMFWLDERKPASLAPGKRPRTTLTPSIALRDGEPYVAFGTPGGDQQDQWSLAVFLRHVCFGMNLQAAIDAPAFHSEHAPSSFFPRRARPNTLVMESRFPEAAIDELARRGHDVELSDAWSLGRICAVGREGRIMKAAANPRLMQNYAIGR